MKSPKVLLAAIGVVLVLIAAVVWGPGALRELRAPNERGIQTITVATEAFERVIPAEGYLKAEKATPITGPPGRSRLKIAWLKENGSAVKEGDVVVRFDRAKFETDLENGKSDAEVAEAKLSSERVQSKNAQTSRSRTAAMAEMDLQVTQDRAKEGGEDIYSRNELLNSRIDGLLSEARVEHSGKGNRIDRSISRKKIELLKLQKKAAELSIEQAKAGLGRMEVVAPHDGIFVYHNAQLKAGDMVYPGRPIGRLPLVDSMEAEVFVLEADAMGLKPDIPATLSLEAHGDKNYEASIKKVDALAKRRQRQVPIQYFAVTLAIAKTDNKLMKPGQRVNASLHVAVVDALVVPRQCIFDLDGEIVVYRRTASSFEAVKVKLGAGTPGRVVVDEGLNAGDVIATQHPFELDNEDDKESESSSEDEGNTEAEAP
jgi:HlyD family secretion protein